jgi:anaerobic dimethyl sulfoxide reductase subunit A
MTATAKFADILLPKTTLLERTDLCTTDAVPVVFGMQNKVMEPVFEARSALEIASELAVRLGISDYSDKTSEEWVQQIVENSEIPDHETFKKEAIYRSPVPQPHVAFKRQIEDPANNPFPTPSGKIEIYCQRITDIDDPMLPPIPKYIEPWESPNDPLTSKYPLQLVTTHCRRRAHSTYEHVPWLMELETQAIKINTVDAEARGIQDGDLVRVFNDRGEMLIPVKVTERIAPGVADIPQGAWYNPDEDGVDRGGCANVLTRDEPSPCGSMPTNTALVQVERA